MCSASLKRSAGAMRSRKSDLLDGLIASAARHSRRAIVLSRFYGVSGRYVKNRTL